MRDKDSTVSCYTWLRSDGCLQPSSLSPYSVTSTDFQNQNPTVSLLLILSSVTKYKHVSQVPDIVIQVSSWTYWQFMHSLPGNLAELSGQRKRSVTSISLHAACVIHRFPGGLEVSRKYELYHKVEVLRTGQYASERGYSLLVIVLERFNSKIFIFIMPITLWNTKWCSRGTWWGVNMIWWAWIWNILFRVIDAKKAFAEGKVTQAT